MGTTPNRALRYPELTDASNVPLYMQQLATDVDTALGSNTIVWTPFPFASGYMDYDPLFPCQMTTIGDRVIMRGLAKPTSGSWTVAESTIGTVATAFVPAHSYYNTAATSAVASPGRVIVKGANSTTGPGDVAIARSGTVTYVSLDASWLIV